MNKTKISLLCIALGFGLIPVAVVPLQPVGALHDGTLSWLQVPPVEALPSENVPSSPPPTHTSVHYSSAGGKTSALEGEVDLSILDAPMTQVAVAPIEDSSGNDWPISTGLVGSVQLAISRDYILWVGRNDDIRKDDIVLFNRTTGTETVISTTQRFEDVKKLAVHGNRIVWSTMFDDYPNDYYYIYLYDLSTEMETVVSATSRGPSSYIDVAPDIFGDHIVWERRLYDETGSYVSHVHVYWYDILTGIETPLETGPIAHSDPAIFGDRIVYRDSTYPVKESIYIYNLSTGTKTQIAKDLYDVGAPDIHCNRVVWQVRHTGTDTFDIQMYDLSTELQYLTTIASGPRVQLRPAIYGNLIAWKEWDSGDSGNVDIYLYDLSTGTTTSIVIGSANTIGAPGLDGDDIVWTDDRDGDWYVYFHDVWPELETPIAYGNYHQESAAIAGDYIVYEDSSQSAAYPNIYMYDLLTGCEKRITSLSSTQRAPSIEGHRIVWEDYRNGNWDIYMHSLVEGVETQITSLSSHQNAPAIDGDRIVWMDQRADAGDIYMWEKLEEWEEPIITPIATGAGAQVAPAIDGDRIVWQDNSIPGGSIILYDLSTETVTPIAADSTVAQWAPAIDGDRIVWEEYVNNNYDIYLYDLSTGTETRITSLPSSQRAPKIGGDRIVWQDYRNNNWDIYMYDLTNGVETQLTSDSAHQTKPAIDGNRIVWQDARNVGMGWDIYLGELDLTTPVIHSVSDIAVEATSGDGAVVTFEVTAYDAYDERPIEPTCQPASGSTFPLGVTEVTCTATDSAGNSVTATFTITVEDTTPPTIISPSALVVEATGPSGAIVTLGVTASDLVDGPIVPACLPASGSTFPLGVTEVTCTATDSAGNIATATFTVTVEDTTPPTINSPLALVVEATGPSGAIVTFEVTASDLVDGPIVPICLPASGSTFPMGVTEVACTASDSAGNSATGIFTVTVGDTTPPTIISPLALVVEATGPSGAIVTFEVTASDLVDGPIVPTCLPASGSTFALGVTEVACTATDSAGNIATATFTVTVEDTTPPVITLIGSPTVRLIVGEIYVDEGATAFDIVDGNLTSNVIVVNPVDTTRVGTYVVTYDVSDSQGNAAIQVTRTVEVVTPQQAIESIIEEVQELVDDDVLNHGQGNALTVKLEQAIRQLNKGKTKQACHMLNVFVNQVTAFIHNGTLSSTEGQLLIDAANRIIGNSCS